MQSAGGAVTPAAVQAPVMPAVQPAHTMVAQPSQPTAMRKASEGSKQRAV